MARATLADTLSASKKSRDASGHLTDTTSLADLSSQIGMQSRPTTAAGAAAIGGSPAQAAAAAAPNNKNAALSESQGMASGQTLQEAQRQKGPAQATGAEAEKVQKAGQLGGLSSLNDKVQSLIGGYLNKLAPPTQIQAQAATSFQDVPPEKQPAFLTALQAYLASPADMGLLNAASQIAGKPIAPEQARSLVDEAATIGKAGAAAVQDTLTVKDLVSQGAIGMDTHTLSSLLGVTPEAAAAMTIPDLRNAIASVEQKEFRDVDHLKGMLSDPGVSAAERTAAREQLKAYGETGLRTADTQFADLQRSLKDADVVQFGGNTYTVADLLKDSTVNSLITNYLQAAPEDPRRKQLEQTEPEFVNWIHQNEAAFSEAVKKIEGGLTEYSGIQTYNTGLANLGGQKIRPEILGSLMPGYDPTNPLSASRLDTGKFSPAYTVIKDSPVAGAIVSYLNNLGATNPLGAPAVKELSSLTPQQVRSLGLDKLDKSNFQTYLDVQKRKTALANASTPSAIIAAALGPEYQDKTPDQLKDQILTEGAYATLGLPNHHDELASLLDEHGNFNPETIRQKQLAKLSGLTLADMARPDGKIPDVARDTLTFSEDSNKQQQVFQLFGQQAQDGKITVNEAEHANIKPFIDNIDLGGFGEQHPDINKIMESRGEAARIQKYLPNLIPGTGNVSTVGAVRDILNNRIGTIGTDYPTPEQREAVKKDWKSVHEQLDKLIFQNQGTDLARDFTEIRKTLNNYEKEIGQYVQVEKTKAAEPPPPPPPDTTTTPTTPQEGFQPGPGGLTWGPNGEPVDISKADQTGLDVGATDKAGSPSMPLAPDTPSGDKTPERTKAVDPQTWIPSILSDPDVMRDPKKWPASIPASIKTELEGTVDAIDRFGKGLTTALNIPADAFHRLAASMGVAEGTLKANLTSAADKARKVSIDKLPGYLKSLPGDKLAGALAFNADGKIDPGELNSLTDGLNAGQLKKMVDSVPVGDLQGMLNNKLAGVNLSDNVGAIASSFGLTGVKTANQLKTALNKIDPDLLGKLSSLPQDPSQFGKSLDNLVTGAVATKVANAVKDQISQLNTGFDVNRAFDIGQGSQAFQDQAAGVIDAWKKGHQDQALAKIIEATVPGMKGTDATLNKVKNSSQYKNTLGRLGK